MSEPTIDQLPYLCLMRIFRCLGWRELVQCRAVCRLFKLYSDQTDLELVVNKSCRPVAKKTRKVWYLTDRPIDYRSSIRWKTFSSIKPSHVWPFQNLRTLHLDLDEITDFDCSFLNEFVQLTHLDVDWSYEIDERIELTLPNLRVLCVRGLNESPLLLKTPSLQVLQSDDIELIEFEHPETIKQLESEYVRAEFMTKFKNLEVFRCYSSSVPPSGDLLWIWKHLKELRIKFEQIGGIQEKLKPVLNRLADLQHQIKGDQELRVYLNDIQLTNASQLEDLENFLKSTTICPLKNNEVPCVKNTQPTNGRCIMVFDYSDLMSCHSKSFSYFIERFLSIQAIKVTGVVDPVQLQWLLKNTKELRILILANSSLDVPVFQSFLNNLPKQIINRLDSLKLTGNQKSKRINVNFLLRFEWLRCFQSDLHIKWPLKLAEKVFEKFGKPYQFSFVDLRLKERIDIQDDLNQGKVMLKICGIQNGMLKFNRENLTWSELREFVQRPKMRKNFANLQKNT